MRLEQSFEVPVPVTQAWGVLLDLERVAPCMPGATLSSFDGTAFTGTVKVKLGPISLAYRGQGRITERDETSRRVSFVAQGQDSRGAGGASARVSAVLHSAEDGATTLVRVVADLDVSGRAAQFGRGLIADVSGKVIKQFAENLAATIGAATIPATGKAPASLPAAVSIPVQASAVDGVAPAAPPALAPIFTEPTPPPTPVVPVFPPPPAGWEPPLPPAGASTTEAEYLPPTPAHSGPPEFPPPAEPGSTGAPETAASELPAAELAAGDSGEPAAEPGAAGHPQAEAAPLDLLELSGAKGVLRRAMPVLIIVALALAGLVVWLVVSG